MAEHRALPPFPARDKLYFFHGFDKQYVGDIDIYGTVTVQRALALHNLPPIDEFLDAEYAIRVRLLDELITGIETGAIPIMALYFESLEYLLNPTLEPTEYVNVKRELEMILSRREQHPWNVIVLYVFRFARNNRHYVLNWGPGLWKWSIEVPNYDEFQSSTDRMTAAKRVALEKVNAQLLLPTPTVNDISRASAGKNRVIEPGTHLYRGMNKSSVARTHAWLAAAPVQAVHYISEGDTDRIDYEKSIGRIAVFRVKHRMELPELTIIEKVLSTKQELRLKNAPAAVIKAFDDSWIVDSSGKLTRHSIKVIDRRWLDWMCENGFQGYVAQTVEGLEEEICICNWQEHLDEIGAYDAKAILHLECFEPPYTDVNWRFDFS